MVGKVHFKVRVAPLKAETYSEWFHDTGVALRGKRL